MVYFESIGAITERFDKITKTECVDQMFCVISKTVYAEKRAVCERKILFAFYVIEYHY